MFQFLLVIVPWQGLLSIQYGSQAPSPYHQPSYSQCTLHEQKEPNLAMEKRRINKSTNHFPTAPSVIALRQSGKDHVLPALILGKPSRYFVLLTTPIFATTDEHQVYP